MLDLGGAGGGSAPLPGGSGGKYRELQILRELASSSGCYYGRGNVSLRATGAERVGASAGTVNRHLRRMAEEGLVRVVFYGAGAVMEAAGPLARVAGLTVRGTDAIEGWEAKASLEVCAL